MTASRSRTLRRLPIAAAIVLIAALLGGGWLWLRDSSLVAVSRVRVTGLRGLDAGQIRAALVNAARGMTTLDVHLSRLRDAVSAFPEIKGISVSAQFPKGLRIRITEEPLVAQVTVAGRALPVAADGTVLRGESSSGSLPTLSFAAVPPGTRIKDRSVLAQLRVLAAAPTPMLARIAGVSHDYWHGIVVALRQGPSIYFGDDGDAGAKWQSVIAVLAARSSVGASYIDVTYPQRPAAGNDGAQSALSSGAGTGTSGGGAPGTGTGTSGGGAPGTATGATGATGATATGTATGAAGTATGATGATGANGATGATGTPTTGMGATGATSSGPNAAIDGPSNPGAASSPSTAAGG